MQWLIMASLEKQHFSEFEVVTCAQPVPEVPTTGYSGNDYPCNNQRQLSVSHFGKPLDELDVLTGKGLAKLIVFSLEFHPNHT